MSVASVATFSRLKDGFGARKLRVRGNVKAACHLMKNSEQFFHRKSEVSAVQLVIGKLTGDRRGRCGGEACYIF